jgi:hypothetical protein
MLLSVILDAVVLRLPEPQAVELSVTERRCELPPAGDNNILGGRDTTI